MWVLINVLVAAGAALMLAAGYAILAKQKRLIEILRVGRASESPFMGVACVLLGLFFAAALVMRITAGAQP